MAESEQPAPGPQEMDTPEVDPYSPEGAFGQWMKDVLPGSSAYEALSDRALGELLESRIEYPGVKPKDRDIAVAARGALTLQEHNNRRLSGYTEASESLQEVVKTSLRPHHQAELMGKGISPDRLESSTSSAIGTRLRDAMDNVVTPQPAPPPSSPIA